MRLARYKPTVPKCWLFAASGVLWSTVGLTMCISAVSWLVQTDLMRAVAYGTVGAILALVSTQWGFGRIAGRNIRRLRQLPDQRCLFAFQAWKSYLIILFMIALGIGVRQSGLPKAVLAVVYLAVGGALLLSSTLYYGYLARLLRIHVRRRARQQPSDAGL